MVTAMSGRFKVRSAVMGTTRGPVSAHVCGFQGPRAPCKKQEMSDVRCRKTGKSRRFVTRVPILVMAVASSCSKPSHVAQPSDDDPV